MYLQAPGQNLIDVIFGLSIMNSWVCLSNVAVVSNPFKIKYKHNNFE